MKDYLVQLTRYNLWANIIINDFVVQAGEDICSIEQKSSFPTIKDTILHIKNAQGIWLQRLAGNSDFDWQHSGDAIPAVKLSSELVESSNEWINYVASLSESDLTVTLNYKNIKGDPFSSLVGEIIPHIMNHGTFHRGQLVTMFRAAGFSDLRSTDLITWYRQHK